jgi:hypothetical protein
MNVYSRAGRASEPNCFLKCHPGVSILKNGRVNPLRVGTQCSDLLRDGWTISHVLKIVVPGKACGGALEGKVHPRERNTHNTPTPRQCYQPTFTTPLHILVEMHALKREQQEKRTHPNELLLSSILIFCRYARAINATTTRSTIALL